MATIQGIAFKLMLVIICFNLAVGISTLLHPDAYSVTENRLGLVADNATLNEFGNLKTDLDMPSSNIGSFFSSIWDFFFLPIIGFVQGIFNVITGGSLNKMLFDQMGFGALFDPGMLLFLKGLIRSVSSIVFTLVIVSFISKGFDLGGDF